MMSAMTTQFPDYPGDVTPPDVAEPCEQAPPEPQPAPSSYTNGPAQGYPLAVQPDDVAAMLMMPRPLDGPGLGVITEAIRGAQSDVQAYLGRPPVPAEYTEQHLFPRPEGWRLKQTPVLSVVSATPETTGTGQATGRYTVVYVAGLDSVNDPDLYPVVRYIKLHAAYDPFVQILFRQLCPAIATRVMSGSTEGQSATITDALPSSSAGARSSAAIAAQMALPGSPPAVTTLDRWKVAGRRIYQRPTRPWDASPWPYSPPQPGSWGGWWTEFEAWW